MSYQLIAVEEPSVGKAVGDNVFLNDLPPDSKVYLFYYPGAMRDETLENRLRDLGRSTGKDAFVNISSLDDPNYDKISRFFGITSLPVIVITADASLASPFDAYFSTFVRLDNKSLLSSPDRTAVCVQEIVNLYLQGKVAEAIAHGASKERISVLKDVGNFFAHALKSVGGFLANRDYSVSAFGAKLQMKRSGG